MFFATLQFILRIGAGRVAGEPAAGDHIDPGNEGGERPDDCRLGGALLAPGEDPADRRADELAEQKGATLRQIALAWVLHQPLEVYALIGPASVAELDDCLGALEIELTSDELAWLNLEDWSCAQRSAATNAR